MNVFELPFEVVDAVMAFNVDSGCVVLGVRPELELCGSSDPVVDLVVESDVVGVLSHESVHAVLYELEGLGVCVGFDVVDGACKYRVSYPGRGGVGYWARSGDAVYWVAVDY